MTHMRSHGHSGQESTGSTLSVVTCVGGLQAWPIGPRTRTRANAEVRPGPFCTGYNRKQQRAKTRKKIKFASSDSRLILGADVKHIVSQVESAAVASFVGSGCWMCVPYTHHCKFKGYMSNRWVYVQYCFRRHDQSEPAIRHGVFPKV